jgi:hypothetical protein
MAEKSGRKFIMPESVKEFSFLNRWFIFKRKSDVSVEEIQEQIPLEEVSTEEQREQEVDDVESIEGAEVAEDVEEAKEEPEMLSAAKLPPPDRKFTEIEIFRFGPDALLQDRLKMKDVGAARWLSLSAPFPIPDPEDSTIMYPSMEHYIAGMKLKYASNKPNLAKDIMSTSGSIHQSYLNKRRAEGGIKQESARDYDLLAEESTEVKKKMQKSYLNSFRVVFDDMKWTVEKNRLIMEGLKYRWDRDDRFHKIVEAARNQGKYLLYSTKVASEVSELGGIRNPSTGVITGENKIGRGIMEIAGFVF